MIEITIISFHLLLLSYRLVTKANYLLELMIHLCLLQNPNPPSHEINRSDLFTKV